MLTYKTEVRDTLNASYGAAFVLSDSGTTWLLIGHTKNFHGYLRMLNARVAAKNLCRTHHKKQSPRSAFTYVVAA